MSYDAKIAGNIFSLPGELVSFTAGANITKGQLVKVTGSMTVSPAAAATDPVIGVAATSASANSTVTVIVGHPIVWVTAGGAISAGAAVGSDSSARAVAVTTAGNRALGFALEAASAAGDIIRVAVNPHVY
ncbi:MAG: DUF2190 family protein [Candidatus Bathyarchaeia archaeon]